MKQYVQFKRDLQEYNLLQMSQMNGLILLPGCIIANPFKSVFELKKIDHRYCICVICEYYLQYKNAYGLEIYMNLKILHKHNIINKYYNIIIL